MNLPGRCLKCGSVDPHVVNGMHLDFQHCICDGELVPVDRRAPVGYPVADCEIAASRLEKDVEALR